MGTRRQARECALQMLYQMEMSGMNASEILETYWTREPSDSEETKKFANLLFLGTAGQRAAIDELLAQHSTHWRLSRMAAIDKNILRLAVFELKNCEDIPLKVTLNEAIEIAKRYGSEESSAFINGVLDKIAKELNRSVEV